MDKSQERNGKANIATISGEMFLKPRLKKSCNINKEMLPYKIHFFLLMAAMGAVLPYLPVFAKIRLGLTATSLGAFFTAQQVVFLLAKPIVGYIVDYFNRLKAIIIILTVTFVIFYFLLLAIPKINIVTDESHQNVTVEQISECTLCYNTLNATELSFDAYNKIFSCSNVSANELNLPSGEIICSPFDVHSSHITDKPYMMILTVCQNNENQTNDSDILYIYEYWIKNLQEYIRSNIKTFDTTIICSSSKKLLSNSENDTVIASEWCYDGHQKFQVNSFVKLLEKVSASHVLHCKTPRNDSPRYESTMLSSSSIFHAYQFWLFSFLLLLPNVCCTSLFSLADTACYESLQKTGSEYGRQRVWGAVGWGIAAPFAGFLNDYTGDFLLSWCFMAVMCAAQIWNLFRVDIVKPKLSENSFKSIRTVLSSKNFLAFQLGVFMNGIATGFIWFYLTWFIISIGGSRLLVGLAQFIQCIIGEIPFFFYSNWIIEKIGHFNVVTLAILAHGIRFIWYSFLQNPWLVLPIECCHGFTYGIFYASMTSYAKISAKHGTEATTQSVLSSTYEGLGAGLGCVLAGIGFDHVGGHQTFFYASLCCVCATVINITLTLLFKKKEKTIKTGSP